MDRRIRHDAVNVSTRRQPVNESAVYLSKDGVHQVEGLVLDPARLEVSPQPRLRSLRQLPQGLVDVAPLGPLVLQDFGAAQIGLLAQHNQYLSSTFGADRIPDHRMDIRTLLGRTGDDQHGKRNRKQCRQQ